MNNDNVAFCRLRGVGRALRVIEILQVLFIKRADWHYWR